MAKQSLYINHVYGGISSNEKVAIPQYSSRFTKNLDLFNDLSSVTQNPKPTKVSGTTVVELVKWFDSADPYGTDIYSYDAAGNIYKETSGGTWTVDRATATIGNGAAGQGLIVFNDFLYYPTSTTIGRKGRLSGSPSYADDFLTDGTTNIDQQRTTIGQTYTLATSISESATNKLSFTPTRDPLKAFIVSINAKGTGNWTLTLHDSKDVAVGTVTVANASVSTGAFTFTFSSPVSMIIGNTYHIHITSSVADGTVDTSTTSDLSTGYYKTVFGILIADTQWHSAISFLNGIAVCNGRYLAFWDEATYNPNRIVFAAGFKARTLTKIGEWLVIGCWKGTSIDSAGEGREYFWNGISSTFDFFKDVPMGSPNAITSSKNRLFGIYGSRGGMYLGTDPFNKVMDIPKLKRGKKIEVYPGAITEWREQTIIGIAGTNDDNTSDGVQLGIYEYGNQQDVIPEALDYGFTPSHGVLYGSTVAVGAVKGFGLSLYFSWRNGSSYGVDKILKTDNPATAASFESLIFDNEKPQKQKIALKLVVTCLPLASGDSITLKYKVNRTANWTSSDAFNTVGETKFEYPIYGDVRFKEIEVGYDLATTTGYITVTGLLFVIDDCEEEVEET